jgi:hypothetical protein
MWSIGIYGGDSPFHLAPIAGVSNPVLTRQNVSDAPAKFVADPFMILVDGKWHMYFEVLNSETNKGEIGLATSHNGFDWTYQQIVLTEEFHLSYPCVFEWKNDYYMIPETLKAQAAGLYKAEHFPNRWSYVGPLVKGDCADPSIFYFDHKWWMFTCPLPYQHNELRLYFAEDLTGMWEEHPQSPIIEGNKRAARPAGRVIILNDKIIRFAQDCVPEYGSQVRAFEIFRLTTTDYIETEHPSSPVLTASGNGWNSLGMHHIDSHLLPDGRWIACVDGFGEYRNLTESSQTG